MLTEIKYIQKYTKNVLFQLVAKAGFLDELDVLKLMSKTYHNITKTKKLIQNMNKNYNIISVTQ